MIGVVEIALQKWNADTVRLDTAGGVVTATAPCGESRWLTPDDAEAFGRRLIEAAKLARTTGDAGDVAALNALSDALNPLSR